MGLYPDNTEGAVLYNGVSQRRIDRYALRRCRVGITEQEPPIVGGTILDNLTTLLSDDFEADKLNRMLAILGLDKMIAAAENGAAAMLGSKKGGVSGGEKQNIAIVRQDRVGDVGVSAPTADRQTQAAPVLESGIAT